MCLVSIRIVILCVILLGLMIGCGGGCVRWMGLGKGMGGRRVFGGGCGFRLLGFGVDVTGFLCRLMIGCCWD